MTFIGKVIFDRVVNFDELLLMGNVSTETYAFGVR